MIFYFDQIKEDDAQILEVAEEIQATILINNFSNIHHIPNNLVVAGGENVWGAKKPVIAFDFFSARYLVSSTATAGKAMLLEFNEWVDPNITAKDKAVLFKSDMLFLFTDLTFMERADKIWKFKNKKLIDGFTKENIIGLL